MSEGKYLSSNLDVLPAFKNVQLQREDMEAMKEEALVHLRAINPLLAHLVAVKVVVNQRRNFINIRVKREFLTVLHYKRSHAPGLHFFLAIADSFQPFVSVLPVCEQQGLLSDFAQLSDEVCTNMTGAVEEFFRGFKIPQATLHCKVDGKHPKEFATLADALSQLQGIRRNGMGRTFSIDVRIATAMYRDYLPILTIFTMDQVRALGAAAARSDREELLQVDPFVRNVVERNELAVSSKVSTAAFAVRKLDTCFGFFFSDKFEPYLIITAFGSHGRNLDTLTRAQVEALKQAIEEFRARHEITEEARFHYTTLSEREETDKFAGKGSKSAESKAHSSAFHLKLRISNEFYAHKFRVLRSLSLDSLQQLDPVKYNFSRETTSWEETFLLIDEDAVEVDGKR